MGYRETAVVHPIKKKKKNEQTSKQIIFKYQTRDFNLHRYFIGSVV